MYLRLFISFVFGCSALYSYAQDIGAWSVLYALPELSAFCDFPEPVETIEQILEEEQNSGSRIKTWIYAANIETSLRPDSSGQWDVIPEKGYVWRLGIRAMNARSLNLLIENYRMQPGMALYVYDPSMTHVAGPFDHRNNINGGILPVQSIPGEVVIVEWNIPANFLLNQVQDSIFNFQFSITNVGYGFRNMISRMSTDCDVDINCKTGNHWQREKRSVVVLQTGNQYCTGVLINQAVDSDRKKPYILTAHHCISTDDQARRTTFLFGHEKAYCNGNPVAKSKAIAGSSLIATKRELDFTLLEMNENVTNAQRPYYAGWNASSATPKSATGIHHPNGNEKKIAVTNSSLGTGTFKDPNLDCDKDAHWIVRRWDEGITKNGSSGSPIFDDNHFVVGTLTGGGDVSCFQVINDYYSRFGKQWNEYYHENDHSQSLKPWLDPDNKGVTSLWGFDPIVSYEDRCDTLGNISSNESKKLIPSDEWGYLTGHNDRRWISFAEKIRNDTVATIIGIEVHIAKVNETGSKVQFAIWQGNDFPVAPLYVKDTIVTAEYGSYPMHIYFDKTVKAIGDFFVGYSIEYGNPVDTFAVYQSAKRLFAGPSSMYVEESGGTWMALNEYIPPIHSSLGVRVMGRFGKLSAPYNPSYRKLKFFFQLNDPNLVSVYLEGIQNEAQIECYDVAGKRMSINEVSRDLLEDNETAYLRVVFDVSHLPSGTYLIQAIDKKKKLSGKFIKI